MYICKKWQAPVLMKVDGFAHHISCVLLQLTRSEAPLNRDVPVLRYLDPTVGYLDTNHEIGACKDCFVILESN